MLGEWSRTITLKTLYTPLWFFNNGCMYCFTVSGKRIFDLHRPRNDENVVSFALKSQNNDAFLKKMKRFEKA